MRNTAKRKAAPQGVALDVSEFDGEKLMPLDTLGGIMQHISRINATARETSGRAVQCPSTFLSGKRSLTTTFCTLDEGHEGEHRGYRKRWPNTTPADRERDAVSKIPHDAYDVPWMVTLRTAPGAALCCDEECELSGFRAHVGPCEPCECPLRHAIEECPANRTDACRACSGQGYHTCLDCKGIGRVPAHPEHFGLLGGDGPSR